ncbi:MAG: hypothetical protein A2X46_05950 [Lentisphaerae bacterium GWF2_57_35]|nr:MAG: hypothetical protein A2X46_05950 [Lentisphaerae bacterium GWF2_57_35]
MTLAREIRVGLPRERIKPNPSLFSRFLRAFRVIFWAFFGNRHMLFGDKRLTFGVKDFRAKIGSITPFNGIETTLRRLKQSIISQGAKYSFIQPRSYVKYTFFAAFKCQEKTIIGQRAYFF